jgi:hypothetical protein
MTRRLPSGRAAFCAVLLSTAVLACETELTNIDELVGDPAFNFVVGPSAAALPSGTVAVGASSVTLTLSNLRALAAGQYQFWAVTRDANNLDVYTQLFGTIKEFYLRVDTLDTGEANLNPITGDTIFVGDSVTVSDTNTVGYEGSDGARVTSARVVLDSSATGLNPATANTVLVTLESSATATPGAAQFLWRRIGVTAAGAMLFGNYSGTDPLNLQSPNDYVFGARGAGTGGARTTELSVDLRELGRPPVGFYYVGYLVDIRGENPVLVDTLRSAWSRDASVSRVNLFDADADPTLPEVVGNSVRNSQVRNCAVGTDPAYNCQSTMALPASDTFVGYETFQLKLEPKGGVAPSRNKSVTHAGGVPGPVK